MNSAKVPGLALVLCTHLFFCHAPNAVGLERPNFFQRLESSEAARASAACGDPHQWHEERNGSTNEMK